MVNALILSLLIPALLLAFLPRIVAHYGGEPKRYMPWLYAACVLYIISWWLPSPLIQGRDTSFTTHFIGGGILTGFIWYYLKESLKWRAHWLLEAFSLFALVSAFGVANELLEVVLYLFGRMPNGISDTSWDLLANTCGAAFFYVIYLLICRNKRHE